MAVRAYWIVGPGRMGLSIGALLAQTDAAPPILFVGRRPTAPAHPLLDSGRAAYASELVGAPAPGTAILFAVPDGAVATAAAGVAGLGPPGADCVALHLSGALASDTLAPLAELGYAVGSLHPLQTVADPIDGAGRLRGSYFTFEGGRRAKKVAQNIVRAAEGRLLELRVRDKARYHAACVFASNYVVACAAVAVRLLAESVDISEDEARQALSPLLHGALANLDALGLPAALTGPIARGDVETVARHLRDLDEGEGALYRLLALEALRLARRQGLSPALADSLARELGVGTVEETETT